MYLSLNSSNIKNNRPHGVVSIIVGIFLSILFPVNVQLSVYYHNLLIHSNQ